MLFEENYTSRSIEWAQNRLSEEGYLVSACFLFLIGVFGVVNNVMVFVIMLTHKEDEFVSPEAHFSLVSKHVNYTIFVYVNL
ncbi:UNVERIFIED_CONTAM: hypothetical protein RMT77_018734 [Armadillidium vulgare]